MQREVIVRIFSLIVAVALAIPTLLLIRREPAKWRVYVGRWGVSVGLIAIAMDVRWPTWLVH